VTIELEYLGFCGESRARFSCRVTAAGHTWQYDAIFVEILQTVDSRTRTIHRITDEVFDRAAIGAVHYGSKYNIGWDTGVSFIPDWAPPRDIAQAINDAASVDPEGYVITRTEPASIPHCG
jgi:hypothetical protein